MEDLREAFFPLYREDIMIPEFEEASVAEEEENEALESPLKLALTTPAPRLLITGESRSIFKCLLALKKQEERKQRGERLRKG